MTIFFERLIFLLKFPRYEKSLEATDEALIWILLPWIRENIAGLHAAGSLSYCWCSVQFLEHTCKNGLAWIKDTHDETSYPMISLISVALIKNSAEPVYQVLLMEHRPKFYLILVIMFYKRLENLYPYNNRCWSKYRQFLELCSCQFDHISNAKVDFCHQLYHLHY